MYNYFFEPKAQQEYEESIKWYSEKSASATLNFIATIENTIVAFVKIRFYTKRGTRIFTQQLQRNILIQLFIQ